jgi:hypothetical protein
VSIAHNPQGRYRLLRYARASLTRHPPDKAGASLLSPAIATIACRCARCFGTRVTIFLVISDGAYLCWCVMVGASRICLSYLSSSRPNLSIRFAAVKPGEQMALREYLGIESLRGIASIDDRLLESLYEPRIILQPNAFAGQPLLAQQLCSSFRKGRTPPGTSVFFTCEILGKSTLPIMRFGPMRRRWLSSSDEKPHRLQCSLSPSGRKYAQKFAPA